MKRYKIEFTDRFRKDIKKLSNQDQSLVLKTVKIMEDDPYYNSTKTKKMRRGKNVSRKILFETRVNRDIRLVWYFDDDRIIFMLRVGHHDVEKQRKLQNY